MAPAGGKHECDGAQGTLCVQVQQRKLAVVTGRNVDRFGEREREKRKGELTEGRNRTADGIKSPETGASTDFFSQYVFCLYYHCSFIPTNFAIRRSNGHA